VSNHRHGFFPFGERSGLAYDQRIADNSAN
jgi:hypothetical protein